MAISKLQMIKDAIKARGSALIAFSGGVDSTVLASLAYEVLGDRALAVTLDSPLFPRRQLDIAVQTACELGLPHKVLSFPHLSMSYFSANPLNRCYFCKKALLNTLVEFAEEEGYNVVLEGTNASEIKGHRPGHQALLEAGEKVFAPFLEFEVTKAEVREIASSRALSAAHRPSMACLASRFPYGQPITPQALQKIEQAEEYLYSLGFLQARVRMHANLARIEVSPEEFPGLLRNSERISEHLKNLEFDYVTLDLEGFRSGSMDEPHMREKRSEQGKSKDLKKTG
ncbi:MAG: ATP-dependent sacrificial sulfur transferase LarE [Methanosarcinaceae archaeon]|nr:ATP-dependent sacrificial sulfur transferase LarE [Methanosarcinaceae archaeon]